MKLQRNNKYAKKITAGLGAVILSASILVGCGNNTTEKSIETPTVTEMSMPTPEIKNEYYYLNYYKLSDDEVNNALKDYELKFPDSIWRMNQIYSLIIKDSNENYKVLQIIYILTTLKDA